MKTITLNSVLCKSCGICLTLCPKNVFTPDIEGKPVSEHADACIGCKICEMHCPEFALKVEDVKNG